MSALKESGISDIDLTKNTDLKYTFDNWDYLNYVMKEILRLDGSSVGGLIYYAKEDVNICSIPFSKGFEFIPNN